MKHQRFSSGTAAGLCSLVLAATAWGHCDTMQGPVIPEARAALEQGDITPVLKWVKAGDEAEVKAAFEKARTVRALGPEARELADHFFLETLVRLHRAGEGAPYTGLKDEPVAPIVALAEQALAEGSADGLVEKMSGHMGQAVREKFARVLAAREHKDRSVNNGREFVEAYVVFMHYVEGIHDAILAAGGHAHESAAGTEAAGAAHPEPSHGH